MKSSCEDWIEILNKAMGDVSSSIESDMDTSALLEEYIIAGKLAASRIEKELTKKKQEYDRTGMQQYFKEFKEIEEGYNIFIITLANLEKSRIMYHLSLGQLQLIQRSNINVQITIRTQMNNTIALIGQLMRNAVLNAKTSEALKGQQSISKTNTSEKDLPSHSNSTELKF